MGEEEQVKYSCEEGAVLWAKGWEVAWRLLPVVVTILKNRVGVLISRDLSRRATRYGRNLGEWSHDLQPLVAGLTIQPHRAFTVQ
jgi:hypothetical protein